MNTADARRFVLLGCLATIASLSPSLQAQQVGDPASLRVGYTVHALGGAAWAALVGESPLDWSECENYTTLWQPGNKAHAVLKPGKSYELEVGGVDGVITRVNFDPPPGYVVMVEHVEALLYNVVAGGGQFIEFDNYDYVTLSVRLEKAPGSRTALECPATI